MIHIVLFQPEIPQNTGNILRTCAATGSNLHIIGPIGFKIDDAHLKRAGMDYIKEVNFTLYENYDEFLQKNNNPLIIFVTRYASKPYSSFDFSSIVTNYFIMFGKESTGIPLEILKEKIEHCARIPMKPQSRSLNLSNCVALVTYEILRQQNFYGLATFEVLKGEDYLLK